MSAWILSRWNYRISQAGCRTLYKLSVYPKLYKIRSKLHLCLEIQAVSLELQLTAHVDKSTLDINLKLARPLFTGAVTVCHARLSQASRRHAVST